MASFWVSALKTRTLALKEKNINLNVDVNMYIYNNPNPKYKLFLYLLRSIFFDDWRQLMYRFEVWTKQSQNDLKMFQKASKKCSCTKIPLCVPLWHVWFSHSEIYVDPSAPTPHHLRILHLFPPHAPPLLVYMALVKQKHKFLIGTKP